MPINDESQIYSKLVVIGFSCIPTHFVLRISVLERQAEGLALSFWRVCTCFHFVWTASCLQAQNGHMLIDSHPHTVRKVGAGGPVYESLFLPYYLGERKTRGGPRTRDRDVFLGSNFRFRDELEKFS